MVQIVENWSDITGKVDTVSASTTNSGFRAASVHIDSARIVENYPNLLQQTVGQTIFIQVPDDLAGRLQLKPGDAIEARVRQGGPDRYFVHPDHITKK